MIGNDVIDLEDLETRPGATHPRFDTRVFTEAERRLLESSDDPGRTRWVVWAAKEAAYKLARAGNRRVVFSPPRFEVVRLEPDRAWVCWRARRFTVDLSVRPAQIHAVARNVGPERIVVASACCLREDPSRAVRALAVETVAAVLGASPFELRVERARGEPPVLLRRGRRTGAEISLSHHGRFVAFACELPPGAGWSR